MQVPDRTQMAGVALHVSDIEKSIHFWRDLLGLRSNFDTDWQPEAALFIPSGTEGASEIRILGLIDPSVPEELPLGPLQPPSVLLMQFKGIDGTASTVRFQDPGAMHIAWWINDFDARIARFVDAGYPLLGPIGPAAVDAKLRLAFVTDPDGFIVELLG